MWSAIAPPHGAKLRSRQKRATVLVALTGAALTYVKNETPPASSKKMYVVHGSMEHTVTSTAGVRVNSHSGLGGLDAMENLQVAEWGFASTNRISCNIHHTHIHLITFTNHPTPGSPSRGSTRLAGVPACPARLPHLWGATS